jgi:hypothetical protein
MCVHAHGEGAEIGQVAEVPEEAVAGDGIRAARKHEQRGQDADEQVVDREDAQGAADVEGLELGAEAEPGCVLSLRSSKMPPMRNPESTKKMGTPR